MPFPHSFQRCGSHRNSKRQLHSHHFLRKWRGIRHEQHRQPHQPPGLCQPSKAPSGGQDHGCNTTQRGNGGGAATATRKNICLFSSGWTHYFLVQPAKCYLSTFCQSVRCLNDFVLLLFFYFFFIFFFFIFFIFFLRDFIFKKTYHLYSVIIVFSISYGLIFRYLWFCSREMTFFLTFPHWYLLNKLVLFYNLLESY